jgi:hypothetical protein
MYLLTKFPKYTRENVPFQPFKAGSRGEFDQVYHKVQSVLAADKDVQAEWKDWEEKRIPQDDDVDRYVRDHPNEIKLPFFDELFSGTWTTEKAKEIQNFWSQYDNGTRSFHDIDMPTVLAEESVKWRGVPKKPSTTNSTNNATQNPKKRRRKTTKPKEKSTTSGPSKKKAKNCTAPPGNKIVQSNGDPQQEVIIQSGPLQQAEVIQSNGPQQEAIIQNGPQQQAEVIQSNGPQQEEVSNSSSLYFVESEDGESGESEDDESEEENSPESDEEEGEILSSGDSDSEEDDTGDDDLPCRRYLPPGNITIYSLFAFFQFCDRVTR